MPAIKNAQIQWNAPQTHKFSADKLNDYITQGLDNLSRVAGETAETTARFLDEEIAAQMKKVATDAARTISEENKFDGDYSGLNKKIMDNWDKAFSQFDSATQTRFNRNNPRARDIFELKIGEEIVKKERAQQAATIRDLKIPSWTTDVMLAKGSTPEETMRIQDELQQKYNSQIESYNLDVTVANQLKAQLANSLDVARVTTWLANNELDTMYKALNDKNQLTTFDAATRASYLERWKSRSEQLLLEEEQRKKAIAEAEANGSGLVASQAIEAHKKLIDINAFDAAAKFEQDFYTGKKVRYLDDDGNVQYIDNAGLDIKSLNSIKSIMETTTKNSTRYAVAKAKRLAAYNDVLGDISLEDDGTGKLMLDKPVTADMYLFATDALNDDLMLSALGTNELQVLEAIASGYIETVQEAGRYSLLNVFTSDDYEEALKKQGVDVEPLRYNNGLLGLAEYTRSRMTTTESRYSPAVNIAMLQNNVLSVTDTTTPQPLSLFATDQQKRAFEENITMIAKEIDREFFEGDTKPAGSTGRAVSIISATINGVAVSGNAELFGGRVLAALGYKGSTKEFTYRLLQEVRSRVHEGDEFEEEAAQANVRSILDNVFYRSMGKTMSESATNDTIKSAQDYYVDTIVQLSKINNARQFTSSLSSAISGGSNIEDYKETKYRDRYNSKATKGN